MKRALVLISSISTLALLGCDNISLEGDAARPFACIPHAPADAGKQCSDGWSCGFDEKCFKLDSGQAEAWRCLFDDECPSDWRCGANVNDTRFCQQLDAGAPSACNVLADCQGGWRCGFENVCFDPSNTTGGNARQCDDDSANQCPEGFRCGQHVPADGGIALCLKLDAGTEAPCTSDRGCEGGFRCNTREQRCLKVTDVIDPGPVETFTSRVISPLSSRPTPSLLSATKLIDTPLDLLDRRPPPGNNPPYAGVMFAAVYDGGVQVIANAVERERFSDGGRQDVVRTRFFPMATDQLAEIVVAPSGTMIRSTNGAVQLLLYDGGAPLPLGTAQAIRGLDVYRPDGVYTRELVRLSGANLVLLDGGFFPPATPNPPGVTSWIEAMAWGADHLLAWDQTGVAWFYPPNDGGTVWDPRTGPLAPFNRVLYTTGAFVDSVRPGAVLVVETNTGVKLAPYIPAGPMGDFVLNDNVANFAPCPNGGTLLQASFAKSGNNNSSYGAAVRCSTTGGLTSAFSRFNFTGASPMSPMPKFQQAFEQVPDDLFVYAGPVVNATGAALVRAHGGANSRFWYASDRDAGMLPGYSPQRPVVLDRQPDSVIQVPTLGLGLIASSGDYQFELDDELGFVSNFENGAIFVLDAFRNEPNWVITANGALDLTTVTMGGTPRIFMLVGGNTPLTSPISAYSASLTIDGLARKVVLISSGDALWATDVTEAVATTFGPQATLLPVFVPQPGVRVRSLTLADTDAGVNGFLTTNTNVMEFQTDDFVQWNTSPVVAPPGATLPLEVWTDKGDGHGRVGTRDGRVWSLPIMVELSQRLVAADGGTTTVDDFARRCDAVFAATREGVFALQQSSDGGLPGWTAVASVNAQLETFTSLRFYEARASGEHLYVATPRGQLVEILGGACP
ncbi:MAG: hypothetical protein QM817_26120 [Archangium sp.]